MTNRANQAGVRLEHIIFLYCILALINIPKMSSIIADTQQLRKFDWYVNDITYVFRLLIVFFPLVFGLHVNANMYYKNKEELFINYLNRYFFLTLLFSNLGTVLLDYWQKDDSTDFFILYPKLAIITILLMANNYLIKFTKEE